MPRAQRKGADYSPALNRSASGVMSNVWHVHPRWRYQSITGPFSQISRCLVSQVQLGAGHAAGGQVRPLDRQLQLRELRPQEPRPGAPLRYYTCTLLCRCSHDSIPELMKLACPQVFAFTAPYPQLAQQPKESKAPASWYSRPAALRFLEDHGLGVRAVGETSAHCSHRHLPGCTPQPQAPSSTRPPRWHLCTGGIPGMHAVGQALCDHFAWYWHY